MKAEKNRVVGARAAQAKLVREKMPGRWQRPGIDRGERSKKRTPRASNSAASRSSASISAPKRSSAALLARRACVNR